MPPPPITFEEWLQELKNLNSEQEINTEEIEKLVNKQINELLDGR